MVCVRESYSVFHEYYSCINLLSRLPPRAPRLTLQRTLERLMSSEIPKVEMNWQQQLLFGHNTVVTAAQWKAALPHMYIWIDYARCGTTYNRT